jgi:pimeloyl-ACP methyl ester carboxylesterase
MSERALTVSTEQLLLPLGDQLVNLSVRLFEPPEPTATLVAFHGFVGNSLDFLPLAQMLARNGVRVVAPDMLGRGESVYLADPSGYTLSNTLQAATAVLAKFARGGTVLGIGWGALIGLLGLDVGRVRPRRIIAVDLPLDFSIDTDPAIARAFADRGRCFASASDAEAHVRSSPEFTALPGDADLTHRVRASGSGYRLSHDDEVTYRTAEFGGRDYDLRQVLARTGVRTLLLNAGVPPSDAPGNCTVAGGLSPAGPLLLRSALEQLVVLGFVTAR